MPPRVGAEGGEGVLAEDGRALERELVEVAVDGPAGLAVALDEGRVGGAAGERLEPHRAGAGEQVEHLASSTGPGPIRLKAASRTRSAVGRVSLPFGAKMRAPFREPAMILTR